VNQIACSKEGRFRQYRGQFFLSKDVAKKKSLGKEEKKSARFINAMLVLTIFSYVVVLLVQRKIKKKYQ
jgi:hypothetical protein